MLLHELDTTFKAFGKAYQWLSFLSMDRDEVPRLECVSVEPLQDFVKVEIV